MCLNIVFHQEEPRAQCSSGGSDGVIPVQYLTADRCPAHGSRCYSPSMCVPEYHWPTSKSVMLDDAAGSIMSTTLSADTFTPVTSAQCDPALIYEGKGANCRPGSHCLPVWMPNMGTMVPWGWRVLRSYSCQKQGCEQQLLYRCSSCTSSHRGADLWLCPALPL